MHSPVSLRPVPPIIGAQGPLITPQSLSIGRSAAADRSSRVWSSQAAERLAIHPPAAPRSHGGAAAGLERLRLLARRLPAVLDSAAAQRGHRGPPHRDQHLDQARPGRPGGPCLPAPPPPLPLPVPAACSPPPAAQPHPALALPCLACSGRAPRCCASTCSPGGWSWRTMPGRRVRTRTRSVGCWLVGRLLQSANRTCCCPSLAAGCSAAATLRGRWRCCSAGCLARRKLHMQRLPPMHPCTAHPAIFAASLSAERGAGPPAVTGVRGG